MQLGLISSWDEKGFEEVAAHHLPKIEFCINHNVPPADFTQHLEEIRKYSKKYGVAVGSMGRWGAMRIREDGSIDPEKLEEDLTLIRAAGELGCPVYNCGVNYIESRSYEDNCRSAIDYLSKLLDCGRENGVKIAVYNCDWCNFIYEAKAWGVVLSALPELGIKYDVSHCMNRGGDYEKEMADWGSRFYHFHLKGTLKLQGQPYHDPPAGMDQTNWGSVFALLYRCRYNGMLSIEPHSGIWTGDRLFWAVEFTIKYMSQYIIPEDYRSPLLHQ